MVLGQIWEQLVFCVCRPPRDSDFTKKDLLGGESGKSFRGSLKGSAREDVVLRSKRGEKLECCFYKPGGYKAKDGRFPCIIYCHCNSGSRRDAEEAISLLLPVGVAVFCMDFAGSGLSEGEYVTLGHTEADDVEVAVNYLREKNLVSTLGLWGRSMGAVTALVYSQRDPSIAGMVLDSPFARLTDLMLEIVQEQKLPIPKALLRVVLSAMRRAVRRRANFDINTVAPIDVVSSSFIPALFGHGKQDCFIKIHHSQQLFEKYAGDKNMVSFEGDHNSRRPEFFYTSVHIFFENVLQVTQLVEKVETPGQPARATFDSAAHQRLTEMMGPHAQGQTGVPWAINQQQLQGTMREQPAGAAGAIAAAGAGSAPDAAAAPVDGLDPSQLDGLDLAGLERLQMGPSGDGDVDDDWQFEDAERQLQAVLEASLFDAQMEERRRAGEAAGAAPAPIPAPVQHAQPDDDNDEDLRRAIEASLQEYNQQQGVQEASAGGKQTAGGKARVPPEGDSWTSSPDASALCQQLTDPNRSAAATCPDLLGDDVPMQPTPASSTAPSGGATANSHSTHGKPPAAAGPKPLSTPALSAPSSITSKHS